MKGRSKYRAVKTQSLLTKRTYDSKREAMYADKLEQAKREGRIADYLEQVPIKLPGGITYRCDFMVLGNGSEVRFIEVKGFETQAWKLKLRLLQEARPWVAMRLEIVR